MADYEIISSEEIGNSQVLDTIENKAKTEELTYREEKTLEYLKKINKISRENLEKAKKELIELEIPRLESNHIIKILDIMPKNGTELRAIVSNSGVVLVDESAKKILGVLSKY